MTEKQKSVESCTKSPKKETPPIYGNRCGFDRKRKGCPYEAGMNRLKSYKSSNVLLCKIILYISFPTTATRFLQLRTYPTTGEVSHQNLLTVRIQCSNLSKLNNFFPLQEAMLSYNKTKVSPYDPTKLAIHSILRPEDDVISNCGQNFKKTVSFVDIVHFIDGEDIVTYEDFDCGITFYPETPTNIRQINREQNYISRSCEKSMYILGNDRHNSFIDEPHNSNIFLNSYNLWDMVPAALMSLNHTNDIYSMSNHYPQPTTHQPRTDSYPKFSSLRRMAVKGRDCASALHFFKEITYQRDE